MNLTDAEVNDQTFRQILKDLSNDIVQEQPIIDNMFNFKVSFDKIKTNISEFFQATTKSSLESLLKGRNYQDKINETYIRTIKETSLENLMTTMQKKDSSLVLLSFKELFNVLKDTKSLLETNKILAKQTAKMMMMSIKKVFEMYGLSINKSDSLTTIPFGLLDQSNVEIQQKMNLTNDMMDVMQKSNFMDLIWTFPTFTFVENTQELRKYLKEYKLGLFTRKFSSYNFTSTSQHYIISSLKSINWNSSSALAYIDQSMGNHFNKTDKKYHQFRRLLTRKPLNTFLEPPQLKYEDMKVYEALVDMHNNIDTCKTLPNYCGNVTAHSVCKVVNGDQGFGSECECTSGYKIQHKIDPNVAPICTNINECLLNRCDPIASCTDTDGSFICECPEGKSGNGLVCNDACAFKACEPGATCVNVESGAECRCNKVGLSTKCGCRVGQVYVQNLDSCQTVEEQLIVNNLKLDKHFSKDMSNPNTKAFKNVEQSVKNEILPVLQAKNPNVKDLRLTNIRNGSVVVDFVLILISKEAGDNTTFGGQPLTTITPASALQILKNAVQAGKVKSLKVIGLPTVLVTNPCDLGSDDCVENSHCTADASATKKFQCVCDSGYEPEDGKCVDDRKFVRIGVPIIVILVILFGSAVFLYVRHKNKQSARAKHSKFEIPQDYSNPVYTSD